MTWDEYNAITDAVDGKGGITPMLLQGIMYITWHETYGQGYDNDPQEAINDLTTWGLPATTNDQDCSVTPTSDPVSGFNCFEYAVLGLGIYAVNHNKANTPTPGSVAELNQAHVYPIEYLFLLQEQHWADGKLQAADLAHLLGDISDDFPELFEIAAAATSYVQSGCGSSRTKGVSV